MSSIALVDCNNFFVSCERVFDPALLGKPVVVLSSNDGCIISRSQEAKKLGIPMGAPFFQWSELMERQKVIVRSSNFPLYADMSARVMQTLAHFNSDMEIYSIDEAFLSVQDMKDPVAYCKEVRAKVLQWTGIPISIGIAPTKTLSKVGNHIAKKHLESEGVFMFSSPEHVEKVLEALPVGEVWGIGRRIRTFLAKRGIFTAAQFKNQPDEWIKKALSVVGLRTAWELRGIPCLSLEEEPAPKQSIMTSRSFGRPVTEKRELHEAIATYAARGGEKLREEKEYAHWLQVFIMTGNNSEVEGFYANQAHCVLPHATDFTPTLLHYAAEGLERIYRPGYAYKRAGILLGGLVSNQAFQQDLFMRTTEETHDKQKRLMTLMDQMNASFRQPILQFAAEGINKPWQGRRSLRSPCYTTSWEELLQIKV